MSKTRGHRTGTDASSYANRCLDCADTDPQVRSRHQMKLARVGGLENVRTHLTEQWVSLRDEGKQRPDLVDDVCHWLANLIEQFSGMAHPETGATLSWWEARRYMSTHKGQIASAAGAHAPERTLFSAPAAEVPGFTRVTRPQETPFAEEAAYVGAPRIHEIDEYDYTPELQEQD